MQLARNVKLNAKKTISRKIQEVIMLENVGGKPLQTISKSAFQGCTNLTNVVIPNGIVTIDDNAFQYCPFQSISLPNTLQYINNNAFSDCGELRSVTIPASVKDIGTSAFQKNFKMTDVYVLGDNVTIRNGAFNENETYNFSYTDDGDGIVEYEDWGTNNPSASPHPLRLHIPDTPNAKSRYINLCLQALNDPEMTDATMNKGPEGVVPILKKYGFNDSSIGTVMWKFTPSSYVVMDGKKYFKDGDGKFNLPGENGITNDYGGWRNFMLVATDIEEKIWYDGRLVESRWYTAVFPFDMSYNQVMTTFGAKTDVREFSYVNEHKNENGQTVRTVSFYDYPEIPDGDKNKPGWVKTGVPYMIHPGVRSVPVTRAGSSKPTYRTIAGVDVEKAKKEEKEGTPKTVTRNLIDGEKLNTKKGSKGSDLPIIEGTTYTFTGTYTLKDIPANSFYLGYEPPRWPLAFYVTTVVQPNKWNPYTSIVQKQTTSGDSNAKTMDLGFENIIEDDFGIATEVVNFVVQQNIQDNKVVYNLNGQVVRENNASLEGLSKGVYVVNGKKIVVR